MEQPVEPAQAFIDDLRRENAPPVQRNALVQENIPPVLPDVPVQQNVLPVPAPNAPVQPIAPPAVQLNDAVQFNAPPAQANIPVHQNVPPPPNAPDQPLNVLVQNAPLQAPLAAVAAQPNAHHQAQNQQVCLSLFPLNNCTCFMGVTCIPLRIILLKRLASLVLSVSSTACYVISKLIF